MAGANYRSPVHYRENQKLATLILNLSKAISENLNTDQETRRETMSQLKVELERLTSIQSRLAQNLQDYTRNAEQSLNNHQETLAV